MLLIMIRTSSSFAALLSFVIKALMSGGCIKVKNVYNNNIKSKV